MKQTARNVSTMSNERRNAYVTQHLTQACLELLKDKPLADISICELCEAAGVGRASFYRNFESREDVLRTLLERLFSEWTNDYENGADKSLERLVHLIFSHFESHRKFYGLLNERKLVYLLKDSIIDMCGPKPEDSAGEAYAKAFASYTLYGLIEVWFQRGMKESAEEMALLFEGAGL